jgi:hypothetical protein
MTIPKLDPLPHRFWPNTAHHITLIFFDPEGNWCRRPIIAWKTGDDGEVTPVSLESDDFEETDWCFEIHYGSGEMQWLFPDFFWFDNFDEAKRVGVESATRRRDRFARDEKAQTR